MNLKFEDEALEDLRKLDEEIYREVLGHIHKLEENPLPENSKVIPLEDGTQMQRLKLQAEDRNSQLNHRIFYNIEDKTIRIYGVFRDR
ncbi:MAG: type II toxin-antitoxin system RelE/ParE family toxin [Candidatus Nanohalobium sp.]